MKGYRKNIYACGVITALGVNVINIDACSDKVSFSSIKIEGFTVDNKLNQKKFDKFIKNNNLSDFGLKFEDRTKTFEVYKNKGNVTLVVFTSTIFNNLKEDNKNLCKKLGNLDLYAFSTREITNIEQDNKDKNSFKVVIKDEGEGEEDEGEGEEGGEEGEEASA